MAKKENEFQDNLRKEIEAMFPGCLVVKNDPNYLQGIPDLSIFYKDKWAMLEVKKSKDAPDRPNQPYYISLANEMSFGAKIYPENKEEVLHDLQQAFESSR